MFNFAYFISASMVNLLVLIQSTTNKYDVWIAFFTALFSFLGMIAAAWGPLFLAKRNDAKAEEVKEELKVAALKTEAVKQIVNGNTTRLMNQVDTLQAEVERLRNAQG